jgi:hypothetical protein
MLLNSASQERLNSMWLVVMVTAFKQLQYTDHATSLYTQKLALTSPTSGGRSVGIVRSRTKATELVYLPPTKFMRPSRFCYHKVREIKRHESVAASSGVTFISNYKIRQSVHMAGQLEGQPVGETDRHYCPQYVPAFWRENTELTSHNSAFVSSVNGDSVIHILY